MTECLICKSKLIASKLKCASCHTCYEGEFVFPKLARLSKEEQQLCESLILHGGNLKEMADTLDISYPTLKKRLNELKLSLLEKKSDDKKKIDSILDDMESKKIDVQEGIKLIRDINAEL